MEKHYAALEEADGAALAQKLSAGLFSGVFLALFGELGAGKTSFVRALAAGMGITDVASPTFTIVREHWEGRLPLFHFDAYRLSDADELYAIGFEDYLRQHGVIAMEWCERVIEALPAERLEIHLAGSGEERRSYRFISYGAAHDQLLEALT